VLRVGPDKQDGVHNWHEELSNFSQIKGCISKFVEVLFKCLEILVVFVSFKTCSLHLFLELAKSASLSGLVLLEELEDFFDALACKLFTN
jgi:hypothetical protein